jgi:hypothetical protein
LANVGEGNRSLLKVCGSLAQTGFRLGERESSNVDVSDNNRGIDTIVVHLPKDHEPSGQQQEREAQAGS